MARMMRGGGDVSGRIRDRIKEFRRVPAEQLKPSPLNFREHPNDQREAVRAILQEIGYAGAAVARELPDGSLELIDGHLRQEESQGQLVPTLVLDVNAEEAATLVALYDPIGDLARVNRDLVSSVLSQSISHQQGDNECFAHVDFYCNRPGTCYNQSISHQQGADQ